MPFSPIKKPPQYTGLTHCLATLLDTVAWLLRRRQVQFKNIATVATVATVAAFTGYYA